MPIDLFDADGSRLLMHLNTDALTMLTGLLDTLGADTTWLSDDGDVPASAAATYGDVLTAAWEDITVTTTPDDRYVDGQRKTLTVDDGDPLERHPATLAWLKRFTDLCRTEPGFTITAD